ncbi:GNAT family N-acetyltransferase [Mycolicibacterium agri]|uniref:N-acetyltransferase domain-containing protein n=1 Tax=Mycolicibacterium agri TaxID=36811 RepID=A0A7I9W7Z3_MYCAG|nr:GNAT family N-acetyltransferase [Mycolicibacterium agri]GFG53549.1 hypothetical protein MAGR_49900 [Mycolicibacterium agri]
MRRVDPDIVVREWRPEDLPNLERLGAQLSRRTLASRFHGGATGIPEDYLNYIRQWWPTRWNAAVALRGGILIGWSEYSLDHTDLRGAEVGVCVAEAEQGRGLGTALVRAAIDLCVARDVSTIHALVSDDNAAALCLYRKVMPRNGESKATGHTVTYRLDIEPSAFTLSSAATASVTVAGEEPRTSRSPLRAVQTGGPRSGKLRRRRRIRR